MKEKIIKDYENGLAVYRIAKKFKIGKPRVNKILYEAGVKTKPSVKKIKHETQYITDLEIKCSVCEEIKNIKEYKYSHVNKKHSHFCKKCGRQKISKKALANEEEIIKLYQAGLSLRNIQSKLAIDNRELSKILEKNDIELRYRPVKVNYVDENHIKCSKCGETKCLSSFPYSTNNSGRDGYYFSYCKSCRREYSKQKRIKRNNEFPWIERCSKLKLRAEKNNLDFNLTPEYLEEIYKRQNGKCFYSEANLEIEFSENDSNLKFDSRLSVDKVVPEKGYTKGNIVLCTQRMNTCKSNVSLEEMKKFMPFWYEKLEKNGFV